MGTKDRNVRLSRTAQNKKRKNRGLMMKKIVVLLLLVTYKWYRDGTDMVPGSVLTVPRMTVPVLTLPLTKINFIFCTGTDEEMRDLGTGPHYDP